VNRDTRSSVECSQSGDTEHVSDADDAGDDQDGRPQHRPNGNRQRPNTSPNTSPNRFMVGIMATSSEGTTGPSTVPQLPPTNKGRGSQQDGRTDTEAWLPCVR